MAYERPISSSHLVLCGVLLLLWFVVVVCYCGFVVDVVVNCVKQLGYLCKQVVSPEEDVCILVLVLWLCC